MQKRTNPLELKVDSTAARQTEETVVAGSAAEFAAAEVVPATPKRETSVPESTKTPPSEKKEPVSRPVVAKRTTAKTPATVTLAIEDKPVVRGPATERESVIDAAPAVDQNVTWQMVMPQKDKPQSVDEVTDAPTEATKVPHVEMPRSVPKPSQPAPAVPEPDAYEQPEAIEDEDDILVDEEAACADEKDVTTDATTEHSVPEDAIVDEEAPFTLEDYEMAAKFSLCGRVSRGIKMGKVSKDLCRLAQLMHPEQSLSAIMEDALLTRVYLENREAFDALAVMLEKKGGHIKC